MKRLLLAPLFLILLTSCQSKRDICASWSAAQINNEEAAEKLDIDLDGITQDVWAEGREKDRIRNFCKYYRD